MRGGRLQQLKERLDRYQSDNEDFIVLHAGISKYRCIRAFLISANRSNDVFIYDAIIPKVQKQTALSVKQETVMKLKADLGALTDEEKETMRQEMAIQMEFLNNPFFYADVPDILVDLNFKRYLKSEFNIILLPDGRPINSFMEIDENFEEVFVAHIENKRDHTAVMKSIREIEATKKSPNVFYTMYRHAQDQATVPLKLENFAETAEFFEGLDPSLQKKSKVSPLKIKTRQLDDPDLISLQSSCSNKEIRFAKCLNKNPLRKASPNPGSGSPGSSAILPTLPQRYVIDKQNYKIPTLRHVRSLTHDLVAVLRRVQVPNSRPQDQRGTCNRGGD